MQSPLLAPAPLHDALFRVAKAVVRCMGEQAEVTMYDLDNLKSPLMYRAGSLSSGRDTSLPQQIGEALRQSASSQATDEAFVFFSKTVAGRTHKHTVTFLDDDNATAGSAPRYACCVTLDVTALLGQLDFLETMLESPGAKPAGGLVPHSAPAVMPAAPSAAGGAPRLSSVQAGAALLEQRIPNGPEALAAHIAEGLRQVSVPVSLMTNHDRMRLVEYLEERGVFLLKGAVDQVAAALAVTRYTVYYYLKKMRA